MVTISELPKEMHLDTQLVKGISGGDTMTARFLHQEFFDFEPQVQLLIATNFYPYADPEDNAFFRRIAIMRFPICFARENPDKHLLEKLKKEANGIVAWALEGLMLYKKEGLRETLSMICEKENYNKFIDPVSVFFEEYLRVTDIRDFTPSDYMDEHFELFRKKEDARNATKSDLRLFLKSKGYVRKQRRLKGERIRGYEGLVLNHFRDEDLPF